MVTMSLYICAGSSEPLLTEYAINTNNEPAHEISNNVTICYVQPAKPQISLRIRTVWSEPLLIAWVIYDCLATDWTSFGVFKLKRRLQMLVQVYTCPNVI